MARLLHLIVMLAMGCLTSEAQQIHSKRNDLSSDDSTCELESQPRGSVLLQRDDSVQKVALELEPATEDVPTERYPAEMDVDILGDDADEPEHLPLCDGSIVKASCRRLNGGMESEFVTQVQLRRFLSASSREIGKVWSTLLPRHEAKSMQCMALCTAVVDNIKQHGGILPSTSDRACYTLHGATNCDVDVTPSKLVKRMSSVEDEASPDHGANTATEPAVELVGLVQRSTIVGVNGSKSVQKRSVNDGSTEWDTGMAKNMTDQVVRKTSASSPFKFRELMERLANAFRIYPSSGTDLRIATPAGVVLAQSDGKVQAMQTVEATIAASTVQAKAWISTVLNELESLSTANSRSKWFGGLGAMGEDEVRTRIVKTMNFIGRELMDDIRYVYPADQAWKTSCGGRTVAYVWKKRTNEEGYVETQGPRCNESDDPFRKPCAIDMDGRYFVYLCQLWYDSIGDQSRISTLVHEAAHHAGPSDVAYDKTQMQQLSQAQQLDNAANFQHFAQDVAQSAWGCADSSTITGVPLTCGDSDCPCPALSRFCEHPEYGTEVKKQCPATCGRCQGPGGPSASTTTPAPTAMPTKAPTSKPTPLPTPRPTPTPAPKQGDCSETTDRISIALTPGRRWTANCYSFYYYDFCTNADVLSACPVTCGACVPAGCEDDPDYAVATSVGLLTCEDWKQYRCWERVVPHCPTACRAIGCAR